jgi:hypothetical protein
MRTQTLKISNKKGKNKISIKFDRKEVSLDKYAGQWVAFLGKKIVGHNRSFRKLVREMEKKKLDQKVTFFAVPEKGYLIV